MTDTIASQGLTTVIDGQHHLVGCRCDSCGAHAFPPQQGCPKCGSPTSQVALPRTGTVWSWTVQRLRPKSPFVGPAEFEPFTVGYVDLGPLVVEARLQGQPVEAWHIGDAVQLVVGEPDADGNIWLFRFEGIKS